MDCDLLLYLTLDLLEGAVLHVENEILDPVLERRNLVVVGLHVEFHRLDALEVWLHSGLDLGDGLLVDLDLRGDLDLELLDSLDVGLQPTFDLVHLGDDLLELRARGRGGGSPGYTAAIAGTIAAIRMAVANRALDPTLRWLVLLSMVMMRSSR